MYGPDTINISPSIQEAKQDDLIKVVLLEIQKKPKEKMKERKKLRGVITHFKFGSNVVFLIVDTVCMPGSLMTVAYGRVSSQ